MDKLTGKTINKIELNEGNDYLVLTTTEGILAFDALGDCCSVSWFAHITGLKNLLGHEIIKVIPREEVEPTEAQQAEGDYEVLEVFGFIMQTEKGTCDVEMRNDSNGYYGGYLSEPDMNKRDEVLRDIREDF